MFARNKAPMSAMIASFTSDEYLAWERQQSIKHEYDAGDKENPSWEWVSLQFQCPLALVYEEVAVPALSIP